MGIFGGGYTKPGKGVDKNEPKKRGPFLYFDIIIHKFMKLLGANCLYGLVSIVWLILLAIFGKIIFTNTGLTDIITSRFSAINPDFSIEITRASISLLLETLFAVGVFTMWGSGPASAAYAYINRCFTRGDHTWIVSDGKDKFKENFKQGMFVVIIDAVILLLGINAICFYYSFYVQTSQFIWLLLIYIMILVFAIYTMMHPYLYQIMVTFECKIGALYKNALLITLAKLPLNLILTAICAAITLGIFFIVEDPIISMLTAIIFGLCFTAYPRDFYAARVIEKSILRDIKAKQTKTVEVEYIEEEE